jgi:penicillin-binding protein 1C
VDNNDHPRFAWKTGTSYGKRDAWAIGFSKNYTIGVWLGNFNGEGSPHLSGAEMAVPLLFELFSAIDHSANDNFLIQPEDVYEREVCAETGLLPSKHCPSTTTDYYIENVSHNGICNVHKLVYVNLLKTVQYCTECLPDAGYEKKVFPIYDPRLNIWLLENDIQFKKLPPHNYNCQARYSETGPRIVSPSQAYEYFIEENSNQALLLAAVSDGTVKTHYWFVNNNYYTKCKPGERVFFQPEPGKLKITCLDDKGRDDVISVHIKTY